ncbi:hypothetical protein SCA6_018493 [Theobroma cacao]
MECKMEDIEVPFYDLETLSAATDGFSPEKLVGAGGFGSVYKAWLLWKKDRGLELIDSCLENSCVPSQVLRCIQLGLLCVQKFPDDRPEMSCVVSMLVNEKDKLPDPKQPGFFIERRSNYGDTKSNREESVSNNEVTLTVQGGR